MSSSLPAAIAPSPRTSPPMSVHQRDAHGSPLNPAEVTELFGRRRGAAFVYETLAERRFILVTVEIMIAVSIRTSDWRILSSYIELIISADIAPTLPQKPTGSDLRFPRIVGRLIALVLRNLEDNLSHGGHRPAFGVIALHLRSSPYIWGHHPAFEVIILYLRSSPCIWGHRPVFEVTRVIARRPRWDSTTLRSLLLKNDMPTIAINNFIVVVVVVVIIFVGDDANDFRRHFCDWSNDREIIFISMVATEGGWLAATKVQYPRSFGCSEIYKKNNPCLAFSLFWTQYLGTSLVFCVFITTTILVMIFHKSIM